MPDNLLLLYPAVPDAAPDPETLLADLIRIGLVGEVLDRAAADYRPGPRFLQLVTYLGCSPVVALGEPGTTGDEFCHLRFDGPYPSPVFRHGDNLKPPRCPACRARFSDPSRLASTPDLAVTCAECARTIPVNVLDWRQSAAHGRFFLTVYGVFEGEAVPGEELLAALADHGGPWRYAYIRLTGSSG